ncbi:CcdC protein domain-containing protein [Sphingomonas sp. CARO-RG-8B-R24-01]|uniref:CcdC protein domain-containing protein n=1 Tax=Sphingomonas sp. CARO-RG-8B-R24-01 TaxID=2914831 RepID=UPI001F57CA71|nr:CcdC protein domain-containing protein [Sphingomonas sp. CARO-RG-8B-R24-01]
MPVHDAQPLGILQYAIPIAIFLVVFGLRARRITRLRPLKIEQLWVVPAIYAAVVGMLFYRSPPTALGWGLAAVALLVGAGLGWQRGKTMEIHVDPETHELRQRASLWALALIVVLIAIKTVAQTEGAALHFDVGLVIDTLGALTLGMFATQRIEMYQRATRLLAAARA